MLGFIGYGNMAGAIVQGIINSHLAEEKEIIVSRRSMDKLQEVQKTLGVLVTTDNREVVEKADTVILAVKPQMLSDVIKEIKEYKTAYFIIFSPISR